MKPQVSARFMETPGPRSKYTTRIGIPLRLKCYMLFGFMKVACLCARVCQFGVVLCVRSFVLGFRGCRLPNYGALNKPETPNPTP